jgi:nickel transport protein
MTGSAARRWSLLVVPLLALAGMPSPALAHKLKVFATVENDQVHGYAFFIGGGRAANANWQASVDGTGVASGQTDTEGGFAFPAPAQAADTTVTVDTGEGHVAFANLPASRFGGLPGEAVAVEAAAVPSPNSDKPGATVEAGLIEAAVQRQIAPLMERIEQMDSRLRLTDIVSGICLILGLGGIALWAVGRRRA